MSMILSSLTKVGIIIYWRLLGQFAYVTESFNGVTNFLHPLRRNLDINIGETFAVELKGVNGSRAEVAI